MNTHQLILPKMPIMANASRKPDAVNNATR